MNRPILSIARVEPAAAADDSVTLPSGQIVSLRTLDPHQMLTTAADAEHVLFTLRRKAIFINDQLEQSESAEETVDLNWRRRARTALRITRLLEHQTAALWSKLRREENSSALPQDVFIKEFKAAVRALLSQEDYDTAIATAKTAARQRNQTNAKAGEGQ